MRTNKISRDSNSNSGKTEPSPAAPSRSERARCAPRDTRGRFTTARPSDVPARASNGHKATGPSERQTADPERTRRQWVTEVPGVNGGYPVITGTRTPVRVIVTYYRDLTDVDRVLELLPHLHREEILAALDYYSTSPERVDEDISRNARTLAELQGRPWPG
jgi:uncharacterized protein (DUF433 family)